MQDKAHQLFLDEQDEENNFLEESIGSEIDFDKAHSDRGRKDPRFASVPNPNKHGLNTSSSQRSETEIDRQKSDRSDAAVEEFKSVDDAFDVGFGDDLKVERAQPELEFVHEEDELYAVREFDDGERLRVYESSHLTGSKNINSVTPQRIDLLKALNYTDYLKDPNYFSTNSMSVNTAILAFLVLDYIMKRPKNQNMYPLPKNKQFLL